MVTNFPVSRGQRLASWTGSLGAGCRGRTSSLAPRTDVPNGAIVGMLPRPRKNDKEVAECDVRGDACDRETLVGLVHLWNARIVHPYDGIREELLELLWRDAKLFEDYGRHPVARHLESALLNADKDRRDQLQLVKLRVGVRVAKPRVREEDSPHPRLPLDELAALEQLLVLGKNFARGSNVNHVLDGHDPHRERHAGGQGLLRLWCDLWHGSVPTDSFASRRARCGPSLEVCDTGRTYNCTPVSQISLLLFWAF